MLCVTPQQHQNLSFLTQQACDREHIIIPLVGSCYRIGNEPDRHLPPSHQAHVRRLLWRGRDETTGRYVFNAQALKALGIDPAEARGRGYSLKDERGAATLTSAQGSPHDAL
jgi:hypothetical protein